MHSGEDRDHHGYYYQRTGALKDGTSKLSQHIVNVLRLAVQLSLIMTLSAALNEAADLSLVGIRIFLSMLLQ